MQIDRILVIRKEDPASTLRACLANGKRSRVSISGEINGGGFYCIALLESSETRRTDSINPEHFVSYGTQLPLSSCQCHAAAEDGGKAEFVALALK